MEEESDLQWIAKRLAAARQREVEYEALRAKCEAEQVGPEEAGEALAALRAYLQSTGL